MSPLSCVTYGGKGNFSNSTLYRNYLDRQNISSAKLAHLLPDLGMTAIQYSTAGEFSIFIDDPLIPPLEILNLLAILFAGYVSLQVPSNMVASKIKYPGIYICGMCAAWGIISEVSLAFLFCISPQLTRTLVHRCCSQLHSSGHAPCVPRFRRGYFLSWCCLSTLYLL